jgi:hypothetical protein
MSSQTQWLHLQEFAELLSDGETTLQTGQTIKLTDAAYSRCDDVASCEHCSGLVEVDA